MLQAKSVPMNGQTNTLTADGHRTDESKLAVEVLLAKRYLCNDVPVPVGFYGWAVEVAIH